MAKKKYSDKSFWSKAKDALCKIGKKALFDILVLYYTSKECPAWAKTLIGVTIAYFISPVDAIPDILPGGYADDLAVVASTMKTVSAYITPEIKKEAKEKLKDLAA